MNSLEVMLSHVPGMAAICNRSFIVMVAMVVFGDRNWNDDAAMNGVEIADICHLSLAMVVRSL